MSGPDLVIMTLGAVLSGVCLVAYRDIHQSRVWRDEARAERDEARAERDEALKLGFQAAENWRRCKTRCADFQEFHERVYSAAETLRTKQKPAFNPADAS